MLHPLIAHLHLQTLSLALNSMPSIDILSSLLRSSKEKTLGKVLCKLRVDSNLQDKLCRYKPMRMFQEGRYAGKYNLLIQIFALNLIHHQALRAGMLRPAEASCEMQTKVCPAYVLYRKYAQTDL